MQTFTITWPASPSHHSVMSWWCFWNGYVPRTLGIRLFGCYTRKLTRRWVVFLNVRYRGSVRWTDRNKKGIPTPNTTETNVFARRYRTTHVTDVFYDWNINIENIINPNFLSTENCQSYNLAIPRHSTTKSARTQCRVVVNFNVIRNANHHLKNPSILVSAHLALPKEWVKHIPKR